MAFSGPLEDRLAIRDLMGAYADATFQQDVEAWLACFTEVGAIEVEGAQATARAWCREILFLKGGGVRKVVGVYDDELVRQDGAWRFARRTYRLVMDEGTKG